jgi:ketosteroid isomerase-like protein
MPKQEDQNRRLVRSYFQALGDGTAGDELSKFFTSDAVQFEFPNQLNQAGGRSDLAAILVRAEQGRKLMTRQSYEIQSVIAEGSRVAVEAIWTGVFAVPVGTLKPGSTMRAHFAVHFEMRDGLIAVQRNYDCFDF